MVFDIVYLLFVRESHLNVSGWDFFCLSGAIPASYLTSLLWSPSQVKVLDLRW